MLYWPIRAFSRGLFERVPARPEAKVDVVPVDYVADALVHLLEDTSATGVFNLVSGDDACTVDELVGMTASAFGKERPPVVAPGSTGTGTAHADDQAAVYFPYFDMDMVFDDSHAREVLGAAGIRCPHLTDYFPRLIEYAQTTRWGKGPLTREEAGAAASRGVTRREELRARLGPYGLMARRELDALAMATAGEALAAVVYAVWRWKGWIGAATDGGLYLSRRPRLFGRGRDVAWRWSELRRVRSGGALSVDLDFGDERVELRFMGPHDEFVALLEAARGPGEVTTEEIRELARTKLGSRLAFGYEATIDGLRDRLEPDERVERLAVAKLDFTGLLLVTDRRLLLLDVGVRAQRRWEAPRDEIRRLELVEPFGLRLTFGDRRS